LGRLFKDLDKGYSHLRKQAAKLLKEMDACAVCV
jgi:hypothetical protein